MARLFNLLMLVGGAIALAFIVDHLGVAGMRRAVVDTGAWFLVIALVELGAASCDARAIVLFLRPDGDVSFGRVLVAQLSGMAINRLTPGRTLGEPVKVTTLMQWVSADVAVPAIVRFNLATMYVGTAAIVVGVPLTVALLDLPHRIEVVVWIAMGVLIAVAVAITMLVRHGAFGTAVNVLVRLRMISAERGERWTKAIAGIDLRLRTTNRAARGGLVYVFLSRCFNWVGTVVVLHAVGIPLTLPLVVASLTVGILVTWVSQIVPLGLGVADGSNYVLYGLLGATSEAGLLFTMVDRLRTIMIAVAGLSVMAVTRALRVRRR